MFLHETCRNVQYTSFEKSTEIFNLISGRLTFVMTSLSNSMLPNRAGIPSKLVQISHFVEVSHATRTYVYNVPLLLATFHLVHPTHSLEASACSKRYPHTHCFLLTALKCTEIHWKLSQVFVLCTRQPLTEFSIKFQSENKLLNVKEFDQSNSNHL